MNKILTIVFKTAEQDISSAMAAAVNELHKLGHSVKEVRLTDDSGETKVAVNQIAGVTEPDPATVPDPVSDGGVAADGGAVASHEDVALAAAEAAWNSLSDEEKGSFDHDEFVTSVAKSATAPADSTTTTS